MAGNQNSKTSTALDIYKEGYYEKYPGKEGPESKRFFVALRNAVIQELETQGFCELLDMLLEKGKGKIDIIVYAVFADIAVGYGSDRLADVQKDPEDREYVPYIRRGPADRGVKWSECRQIRQNILLLTDELTKQMYLARHHVRSAHIKKMEQHIKALQEEARSRQIEREKIQKEAQEEAKRVMEEAKLEAGRIRESAQAAADAVVKNAYEQVKEKSEEYAGRLVRRYLEREQKLYKMEFDQEMKEFSRSSLEDTQRAAAIHQEMCESTNAFQARWIQSLDEAMEQMSTMKAEFYEHLHDWQVSLYPREVKPLAERYLELYRIINVDRLLREEILSDSPAVLQEEDDRSEDGKDTVSQVAVQGLQRLNRTLSTFLRRFEASLQGLDLYVFYPGQGEPFDDLWHVPEDEEMQYHGRRIAECVVPGIARKAKDAYGDDVVVPAVVRVVEEDGYGDF